MDGLQEDLIAILELCPPSASDLGARLQALLRLLQREAHNLRVGDQGSRPTLFAQQVRNRAFLLGISPLQSTAEQRLTALGRPHFRLLWTASRESRDLVRTLAGHGDWVSAVAVSPDARHALSGSGDRTAQVLGPANRPAPPHLRGPRSRGERGGGEPRRPPCPLGFARPHARGSGTWRPAELLRTLAGHEDMVFAAGDESRRPRAVSGSRDRTLRLWDLANRPAPPHLHGPRRRGVRGGDIPGRPPCPLRLARPHAQALGPGRPADSSTPSPATRAWSLPWR